MSSKTTSASPSHKTRITKWAIALAVLIVLALALTIAVWWGAPRYLASESFRRLLGERTAGLLDTPGGYHPLHWSEAEASSLGFLGRGKPERSLQEIRARGMKARFDWSALWQRKAVVEQLTIDQLQAAFGPQTAKWLEHDFPDPPTLEAPVKGSSAVNVDLREVVSPRTTMLWGETAEDFGAFREVNLRLWPVEKNLAAYGAGGTLQIGALPMAGVRDFQLRYEKPMLTVEWGRLTVGGESEVEVSGTFEFTQPGSMDLTLGFRKCPLDPFLKPEMREKADGTFWSDTRVQKEFGEDKPTSYSGPVRANGLTLENISALAKLAAFTDEPRFKNLRLQRLHGHYVYTKPNLDVRDFLAEAEGLIQVEGKLSVRGKKLNGTLALGVSAKLLESFPGARKHVFTKSRDGYDWTTVKLSGTTDQPQEDLKERLIAAAKKEAVETVTAPVKKPLELLKKAADTLADKLKEIF